ncbi:glutathione S-transferase family protein [Rhodovibrio salinarum]|uniref:Glutathione S-transferase family protein n=1 Tax=Rhodovibrio salinarum TaxID=1087 RepID=A0A934QFL0_9PROT|nr:glutathione S-transferase family protein [Rhodovibrio salinarum]MBK1696098.1 glutathione S-transferase family protein [Rhodovibrio salinarum]
MLTLYGRPNSLNVQKAMWAIGELGLAHERIDIGRGHREEGGTPWFRALNPNGKVPVLVDGDRVIWESNAIVRYLAAQYDPGGLWPETAGERGEADQWMDWQQTALLSSFNPAFWQLIRTPEADRDLDLVARCEAASDQAFSLLDQALEARAFISGDRLTMGDIPLGVCAYRWYQLPMRRCDLPNVAAWYARLTERPAFRQHVMIPLT